MTKRCAWLLGAMLAGGCGSVATEKQDAAVQPDTSVSIDAPTCGPSTCASGCCDDDGMCREVPACGTAGAACAAGCPALVPEASNMTMWLVGDDYTAAATSWQDRSGKGTNATCAAATCPAATAMINGHKSVSFAAGQGFSLTDPAMAFKSQSWTFFLVVKPSTSAGTFAQMLSFYVNNNHVKFQRDNASANIAFQVIPGAGTNYLLSQQSFGWSGNWERVFGSVDATGAAKLGVYNMPMQISAVTTGNIGAPTNVDYTGSRLGLSPTGTENTFLGEIAEVIVFNTQLSEPTQQSLQAYLTARYGF